MKILIATLIRRTETTVFHYSSAIESIMRLRWENGTQVDHFMPSGGDDELGSIARKYEQARIWALHGGYDALLTAESDMILPVDALEELESAKADVAYGLYCFRQWPYGWNIATQVTRTEIRYLSADIQAARAAWGSVVPCEGVGLGCTFIRRHVLETVPFRFHPSAHADHLFALDVRTTGHIQVVNTRVVCGHLAGTRVVYPTNEVPLWRMQA